MLTLAVALAAQTPQPAEQHRKLAEQVGIWDAELAYLDFNTGEQATSQGTSILNSRSARCGSSTLPEGDGHAFKGMGTKAPTAEKKMIGTWIDSMTPSLMVIEGNWDDAQGLDHVRYGARRGQRSWKTTLVTTVHSADKHVFQMFTSRRTVRTC